MNVTPADIAEIFEEAAAKGTPIRWRQRAEYGETILYASSEVRRTNLSHLSPEERKRHRNRQKAHRRSRHPFGVPLQDALPTPTHGLCGRCRRLIPRNGRRLATHIDSTGARCVRVRHRTTYETTFVVPEDVRQDICPTCGGVREWRPGLDRPIHLKGNSCRRLISLEAATPRAHRSPSPLAPLASGRTSGSSSVGYDP